MLFQRPLNYINFTTFANKLIAKKHDKTHFQIRRRLRF